MTAGNPTNNTTTGITGFNGTGFDATAATQYNVIVGGSTSSTLANIAPSSTSGVPLISQGSSSNPAFGTAVVAGGGSGRTSATAYAVICGGTTSTGAHQSIASVGTSGQVLTSNGAGALPTFQAASGGGAWTLISSATASSSATVDFTDLSSTYFAYVIIINDIIPANDGVTLFLRTSTDNGVSFDAGASNYVWWNIYDEDNTNFGQVRGAGDTEIELVGTDPWGNSTQEFGRWIIWLFNPSGTNKTYFQYEGSYVDDTSGPFDVQHIIGTGFRDSTADVDAIRFLFSAGNISSGDFRLYGITAS